jgi:hypothetical protein
MLAAGGKLEGREEGSEVSEVFNSSLILSKI